MIPINRSADFGHLMGIAGVFAASAGLHSEEGL
jgi:hypothetical protein